MHPDWFSYIGRELYVLGQWLAEFEAQFPSAAHALGITGGACRDPHVERIIQAFALMAARIHTRLDAALPEIADGLLRLIAPHYRAPIPAMSIAEFALDPSQGKSTHGLVIPKGSMLTAKQAVQGVTCRFQTCYPVTLWPLHVVSARVETPERLRPSAQGQQAQAVLTLTLRCADGLTFSDLALQHLRFYLHGSLPLATDLYEQLLHHTVQVQFCAAEAHDSRQLLTVSPQCLRPVGFGREETLLPYAPQSFMGDRLLLEYSVCPRKFLFFDLYELDRAAQAGCGDELHIRFWLRQMPRSPHLISADVFRLGCAPIVNLFPRRAEPIRVDQRQWEYLVVPDATHVDGMEIYAIDDVASGSSTRGKPGFFVPFYAFKHAWSGQQPRVFWYDARRPAPEPQNAGTEVYLTLVDLDGRPCVPEVETLIAKTTCTNRDLTRALRIGRRGGDFDLEGVSGVATIRALEPLTEPIRVPLQQRLYWRVIAHLGLQHVSVFGAEADPEALKNILKEILTLHDVNGANQKQIDSITAVTSRRVTRCLSSSGWQSVCQGTEITVQFDEAQHAGGGLFLLAAVLDRFFGLCAPLNAFSQLVVKTDQRAAQGEEPFTIWPPKAGG
jgi:type VI secretion system protein ImpG